MFSNNLGRNNKGRGWGWHGQRWRAQQRKRYWEWVREVGVWVGGGGTQKPR